MKHPGTMAYLLVLAAVCSWPAAAAAAEPAPERGDAAQAQSIASSVCAACHGPDGNSPIPANPRIAGQHASYIYKQLSDYKSGRRKNAIMNGIAATLSEGDMRNLAAYFSAQKAAGGGAKDTELIAIGQKLYRGGVSGIGVPACAGCHSPDGAGIPAQYPRLSGQHPEYTRGQLESFRRGERDNDPNAMMRVITQRLSDKELAALAEYIAGLR
jgi:cytochrome c553